jgi:hypothetical protein
MTVFEISAIRLEQMLQRSLIYYKEIMTPEDIFQLDQVQRRIKGYKQALSDFFNDKS